LEKACCETETEASEVQGYSNSSECTGKFQESARFQEIACSGTHACDLAVQSAAVELVHVYGEENMTNNEDAFNGVQIYGQKGDLVR
jgi:hypothetical protein